MKKMNLAEAETELHKAARYYTAMQIGCWALESDVICGPDGVEHSKEAALKNLKYAASQYFWSHFEREQEA